MAQRDVRYTSLRRKLFSWHSQNPRNFPWRNTDDPYAVLIGELLLQRTRGENVVAVYERILGRWPDPEALAGAKVAELREAIRPLGLTKRAGTIAAMAGELVGLDEVPTKPAELMRLPGVGPYVAHAVPIFARRRVLPVVDWVIARVLRRYFGMPATLRPNADTELWVVASELVRPGRARETWLGILDLAAAVCTPRPRCDACPLRATCAYSSRS